MGFLPWHHRRPVAPLPVGEKPADQNVSDPSVFGAGRVPRGPGKPNSIRQAIEGVDTQPTDVVVLDAELHRIEVDASRLGGLVQPAQLNPCVVVLDSQLWVNVRVVSMGKTHNFFGRVDDAWELRMARELVNCTTLRRPNGFEDMRLFVLGGELMACATVFDAVAEMVVLKIDPVESTIIEASIQNSFAGVHEKNWMPLITHQGRGLRFVYSTEPTVVVRYDSAEGWTDGLPSEPMKMTLRGGSQVVPFKDGYLAVVHEVHRSTTAGVLYLHRLVRFDASMTLIRKSEPFRFMREGIEFCAGLAHYKDKWVMSFGASDNEAWLAVVEESTIERMLT